MRTLLVGLLSLLLTSPCVSQTHEMLDLGSIDALRIDTHEQFTGAEAGIVAHQVTIPPIRHEWQLESTFSEALKSQGLSPNADGFGLIYGLNNVDTINDLMGRTDVVIPRVDDSELITSGGAIYEITTYSFEKGIFLNNYEEFRTAFSELEMEIVELNDELVFQSINDSNELFGDIYVGVSQNALPLSREFLDQIGYEAKILQELTYAASSGGLSEDQRVMLHWISEDNRARQELLAQANYPSGGAMGRGMATVTVALLDHLAGTPVNNYRVHAIARSNRSARNPSRNLTSPAEIHLPIATYCYFAIDEMSGERVSPVLSMHASSMVPGATNELELTYVGPQEDEAQCQR